MTTHTLQQPIEAAGKSYTELTLRPMKAKDLRLLASQENDADNQINLLAALAGVSSAVIDELAIADFNALCQEVQADNKKKSAT